MNRFNRWQKRECGSSLSAPVRSWEMTYFFSQNNVEVHHGGKYIPSTSNQSKTNQSQIITLAKDHYEVLVTSAEGIGTIYSDHDQSEEVTTKKVENYQQANLILQ